MRQLITHAALVAGLLAGVTPAAAQSPGAISVSFKLDPRITQGLYMGERWVSPPTYTLRQDGRTAIVHARAKGAAAQGTQAMRVEWIAANPKMVVVTPDEGNAVQLKVLRDGESTLEVRSGKVSRVFTVKASYESGSIVVQISPAGGAS